MTDGNISQEALYEAAEAEKVFAAEKSVSLVRTAVIALNTGVYLFLMDKAQTMPWLAYTIIGVAWTYALFVLSFQPYRKYPIFLASYFTYGTDAVLITFWLLATGGFGSPFYVLWYISIIAVAFRFGTRITLFTAVLYIACYIGLLGAIGELHGHAMDLTVRTGYILCAAYLGILISRETLEQTRQKKQMQELAHETREAKERLQIQSRLYETLLNAQSELGEGVSITEGQRFVYVNDALCRIYGYPEEELMNMRSFLDVVAPEEREAISIRLGDRLSGSSLPYSGQTVIVAKNGQRVNIAYSIKMLEHDGQKKLFSIIRDISEEVRSKQVLEQRTIDLERSKELERKKDEFIGVASHELKTPLTSLKGYVQLLQRTLETNNDPATAQLYATKTHVHIDRLSRLISDLLDSSRIQAGKLQFNITEFDLNELVSEAIESMQDTSPTHVIRCSGELPHPVRGDRMRLEQVLTNFISNAIKYSPKSKEVLVSLEKESNEVRVAVKDSGIGVPRQYLDKIFDRFFRVESAAEKVSGLGIGLYISAEIIRRHGGRIWAESKEGEGSTFYFTLPVE